jgi:hypothetical protein
MMRNEHTGVCSPGVFLFMEVGVGVDDKTNDFEVERLGLGRAARDQPGRRVRLVAKPDGVGPG